MGATLEQHVTFWKAVEDGLTGGLPVVALLQKAGEALAGTAFDDAAGALVAEIENGERLSEAMEKQPELFSKAMCIMTRAGEAGGVLDVVAGRVAKALEDGSFTPPGVETDPQTEQERYWRALGWLLISGVPILQAFAIVGDEIAGKELAEATDVIHRAILEGSSVGDAMKQLPAVFAAEITAAVAAGEEQGTLDEVFFNIADALEAGDLASLVPKGAPAKPTKDAAPVIKVVNLILLKAVEERASDIHIDPNEDGTGRVRLRVDGVLRDLDPLPKGLAASVVGRIKIMANVDVAERRLPQDGRIRVKTQSQEIDLRVCVVPTMLGERVCMRLVARAEGPLPLDRLGLSETDLAAVRELSHCPHGVIIVNGPAGCGKTTLLYAMLMEKDRDKECVMTVEDPVEYQLPGVAQIQIQPRLGLNYARALRAVLRQDLDAVMVGEIRDLETLECAVQVAVTGHLVLTTIHTDNSAYAIRRLLDVGIEPYRLNSSLVAIVSPRLVRMLCDCRQPGEPPLHSVPPEAAEFIRNAKGATFCKPVGCEACRGTGYRGRTAIYEVLLMNDRVRQAVESSPDVAALHRAAVESGMKPMLIDGMEKAAQGITSVEEVCRVASRR